MPAALDVLVLGELNPDVLVGGVRAPIRFGQVETQVPSATVRLGSSGAITAAACASMGLRAGLCAVLGADPVGTLTRSLLRECGVDDSAVMVRDDVDTGMTIVLAGEDGDRAMLTAVGAMAALRVRDIPPALLGDVAHVHISSLFLQRGLHDGLAELLASLRAAGVRTSLDCGWDPEEKWLAIEPLLGALDYLLPNEAELRGLGTALGLDPRATVAELARTLASRGPDVVVKQGAAGALHATAAAGWTVRATPTAMVESTGAGDNFDAGLLWAIHQGMDAPDALVCAAAAGAAAVRGVGGTATMAGAADLHAALAGSAASAVRRVW